MDIDKIRNDIDGIDTQIIDLFKQRMEKALDVARFKKEHGLPVHDTARERQLLHKVSEEAGEDFEIYTRVLFSTLMDLSRSYQHKFLTDESPLRSLVTKAIAETPALFPTKATVACQGVEGAYSQLASDKFFAVPNIMYFSSFEGVFKAVQNGLCRYGVLPIENSTAGSVNKIYDLIQRYNVNIVRTARLQIEHTLLTKKSKKLSDVREIFSHEHAIAQCAGFLETLKGVKITPCENTAIAAQRVAESDRDDVAAISSRQCADQYGLDVCVDHIQDSDANYTRFICISKNLEVYPGADRTSMMVVIPHKPGSLYSVLVRFYALGISLVKLESRPIPGSNFEFMFYFDIEASVYSPALLQILCELETQTSEFRYLGSYNEIN